MSERKKPWVERTSRTEKAFSILALFCMLLFVADIVPVYEKHPHFAIEYWYGGYALMGAGFVVVLIFAALGWRQLVKRKEDYYDD